MANKNKTNKSVKKRMQVTAHGKIKHAQCNRRHLNAHIPASRMRRLRRPGIIAESRSILKKYKAAMGEL